MKPQGARRPQWRIIAATVLVAVVVSLRAQYRRQLYEASIASGSSSCGAIRASGAVRHHRLQPNMSILALSTLVGHRQHPAGLRRGHRYWRRWWAHKIGLMRLSRNWLLDLAAIWTSGSCATSRCCSSCCSWYFRRAGGAHRPQRETSTSWALPFSQSPRPVHSDPRGHGHHLALLATALLIVAQIVLARWARARQARTGRDFPTCSIFGVGRCRSPPFAVWAGAAASCAGCSTLRGFNYRGGFVLVPEFTWRSWRCRPTRPVSSPSVRGRHPVGAPKRPDRR